MKTKTLRICIFASTMTITLFSMLLLIGIITGIIEQLWLSIVVGAGVVIILFNAVLLGTIGIDKAWWMKKDQLDDEIMKYQHKCRAYEGATKSMQRSQLNYHYEKNMP